MGEARGIKDQAELRQSAVSPGGQAHRQRRQGAGMVVLPEMLASLPGGVRLPACSNHFSSSRPCLSISTSPRQGTWVVLPTG